MRLFLFFCFALLLASSSLHAADDGLPEVSESVSDSASSSSSGPFASASDENIKEAQRFFRYCSKNDTMSKQKDCKCAATKYLETRLDLGEDATPQQILAENLNTCLQDERYAVKPNDVADIDKYNEREIEEAEAVFDRCESESRLNKNFDCECLASRFLEERHKNGPVLQQDAILISLQTECKNVVETTGIQYSNCMSSPSFRNTNGIEQRDYCECYARRWAETYEQYSGVVDSKSSINLQANARGFCQQPDNYQ